MADTNEKKNKFTELKADLGKLYVGKKYTWLQILLLEHLPVGDITRKDFIAHNLFNKLEERGDIAPSNVHLLLDISKVNSELKDAEDLVSQYMKDNDQSTVYHQLSQYRRTLFKALREVDPKGFSAVNANYQLENFKLDNIWEVVFYLEVNQLLVNKPDKIKRFADCLGPRAKNILLENGAKFPIILSNPSHSKLSILNVCWQSIEQKNKLSKSLPASFEVVGVGINNPKASLFFRLWTNDQNALTQLLIMDVNQTLIEGLADILVPPANRQTFLDDWETIVDSKEVKAALNKLKDKDKFGTSKKRPRSPDPDEPGSSKQFRSYGKDEQKYDKKQFLDGNNFSEKENKDSPKEHEIGVRLTLVKKQSSSSANSAEQPYALELLFRLMEEQKEWSKRAVDDVHETIKDLDAYFRKKKIQFQKVETGCIVLHLVSHDTEALNELWDMYCNKMLHTDLAEIIGADEDESEHQLIDVTMHEQDYKNALKKLKELEKSDKEKLPIHIKEDHSFPKLVKTKTGVQKFLPVLEQMHDKLKKEFQEKREEEPKYVAKRVEEKRPYVTEEYEDLQKSMKHEIGLPEQLQMFQQMLDELKQISVLETECQQQQTKETEYEKVPVRNEEIHNLIFTYIKEEFCRWYHKKDSLNLLKTLYKDLLLPHMLAKAFSTIDLLEFLIESNHLTSSDFTLFYDTIYATGEFELARKIQEKVITFPNVEEISISKFSRHRCMLVEFGNKLTTKNVESIKELFNEAPTSYEDKWDLINDLENRQIISKGKMQLFIKRLGILKLGEPEQVLTKCIYILKYVFYYTFH